MMSSVYWRTTIGALSAAAFVCAASTAALAQASGDGRIGPLVFDGEALDQSLHALNHHIQDKYVQEDMLAALTEDRAPEFATAAAASAAAPTLEETALEGAFGYVVSDDRSLSDGLALFNAELALRGEDLFIQVAREATVKGDAFALAAAGAGLDAKMAARRQEAAGPGDGFGDQVAGDASLDASMAALNKWMRAHEAREVMLAAAVPPVEADSFARVMVAMAFSY